MKERDFRSASIFTDKDKDPNEILKEMQEEII
jgi:hypothetical protein